MYFDEASCLSIESAKICPSSAPLDPHAGASAVMFATLMIDAIVAQYATEVVVSFNNLLFLSKPPQYQHKSNSRSISALYP